MSLPSTLIRTADYHTAGEPFRIVTDGVETPHGRTVLDRRSWSQLHLDDTRAFLINEPRGHADMYGCFVTPPDDDDGDIGVVFFHKDGFSTACGHGTIALVTWAIESGYISPLLPEGADKGGQDTRVEVIVDAPSGRLRTMATLTDDGRVTEVRFWNVPSFVAATDVLVPTSFGDVAVDVAFGGAFYGSVALPHNSGLFPEAKDVSKLIALGREIKTHFADGQPRATAVAHPTEPRLSGMYGITFFQDLGSQDSLFKGKASSLPDEGAAATVQQRNITIFADGEVDRSPCGSGTSARLALLHHRRQLRQGETFLNHGLAGGTFRGRIESVHRQQTGETDLIDTSVAGSAYETGRCEFSLDERDPIGLGFQLR